MLLRNSVRVDLVPAEHLDMGRQVVSLKWPCTRKATETLTVLCHCVIKRKHDLIIVALEAKHDCILDLEELTGLVKTTHDLLAVFGSN